MVVTGGVGSIEWAVWRCAAVALRLYTTCTCSKHLLGHVPKVVQRRLRGIPTRSSQPAFRPAVSLFDVPQTGEVCRFATPGGAVSNSTSWAFSPSSEKASRTAGQTLVPTKSAHAHVQPPFSSPNPRTDNGEHPRSALRRRRRLHAARRRSCHRRQPHSLATSLLLGIQLRPRVSQTEARECPRGQEYSPPTLDGATGK